MIRHTVLTVVGAMLGVIAAVLLAPAEASVDRGWAYAWIGLGVGAVLGIAVARRLRRTFQRYDSPS